MGCCRFSQNVVGQFIRERIIEFVVTDMSVAARQHRNRSGAIALPIEAVASGAFPCFLA